MTNFPFQPIANTTNQAAVSGTAALNFVTSWPYSGGGVVRVMNSSNNLAFIAFGNAATQGAAIATSMPILPNSVELFTVGRDQTYVGMIAAATATLYFTPGLGGV